MLFASGEGQEAQFPNNRDRNGLAIEREAGFWRTCELWPSAASLAHYAQVTGNPKSLERDRREVMT
jgi:hypothetical protein